jgi:23S rRNA (adenine1618-N6)-methyltransferase
VPHWDIPAGYLCPPIPGRADYIHYLADLLAEGNGGAVPGGPQVRVLDIGVGANCIYPIIGHREYGWRFVGSDIDAVAVHSAQQIVAANELLRDAIELRLQPVPNRIFHGIIRPGEVFDLTLCNPPFHLSAADAAASTPPQAHQSGRAARRYHGAGATPPGCRGRCAFRRAASELWCSGGEEGSCAA